MATEKLFTLDEANAALPLVSAIARDVVRLYRGVKQSIEAHARLRRRAQAGEDLAEQVHDQDVRIEAQLKRLQALVAELEQLGCRLRDYERGVVDFPAASFGGDRFTFYCWMLGEPAVAHWHSEEEGFHARQPLELAAADASGSGDQASA